MQENLNSVIQAAFAPGECERYAAYGHALLGMMRRDRHFDGANRVVDAEDDADTRFLIARTKDYERASLSREAIRALRGDPGNLAPWVIGQIRRALRLAGNRLSRNLFSSRPKARNFAGDEVDADEFAGLPRWLGDGLLFGVQRERPAPCVDGGGCSEASVVKMAEGVARSVDPDGDGFYVVNPARHERLIEQWRSNAKKHPDLPGTLFFSDKGPRSYHVVPDTDCPPEHGYRIPSGALEFASCGASPHLLDRDGLLLRVKDDDGWEVIAGWYGMPICHAPHKFVRITW